MENEYINEDDVFVKDMSKKKAIALCEAMQSQSGNAKLINKVIEIRLNEKDSLLEVKEALDILLETASEVKTIYDLAKEEHGL